MGCFGVVRGHPRSLKIAPFERAHMTSVLSNIVSLVAFKIFDVQFCDISRTVQGHPRSLVVVSVDSSEAVSYSAFIGPIMVCQI